MVFSLVLLLSVNSHAWEPNAKERIAGMKQGDLQPYAGKISAWLKERVPKELDQITKDRMQALLKDPAFRDALIERHFINKCWGLAKFAAADPDNTAFASWIMSNPSIMDDLLLTRTPSTMFQRYDNSWSLEQWYFERWKRIYDAHPESKEGLYLRLAIATMLRPPGSANQGAGKSKEPIDLVDRYAHYVKAHKAGELMPSFDTLSTWDLTHVVSAGAANKDLAWVRDTVHTFAPSFRDGEKVGTLTSQMKYQGSQIPYNDMSCLLAGGGKCGPRSSFGVFVNQAFGIPSIGVGQPAHAAVSHRDANGNWQVTYGRGWNVSKVADRTNMSGGEFLERVRERQSDIFAQVEHLRWLAVVVNDKTPADAIMAVANIVHKDVKELNKIEAPKVPSAKIAHREEAPIKVAPGVIHVEAEDFFDQGGMGGFGHPGVVIGDCYEGGKQINFSAMVSATWAGYKIKVPKTGVYELTAQTAVVNWHQKLYARTFGAMYPVTKATASDVFHNQVDNLGPQLGADGSLGTRWAMNFGKDEGWLALDLGSPRKISKVMIEEQSLNNVSRFQVDYKKGDEWVKIFDGETIGSFKKEFPEVTAQHVRLHTFDTNSQTGGPSIWEFSVGNTFDGSGWIMTEWLGASNGKWQTTKPTEIRLVEGDQTIWLFASWQRGLALRSFQLKPKDTEKMASRE
jgi:hypothetical protein